MKRKSICPLQPPSLSVDGLLSFSDRFIVSFICPPAPNCLPIPHLKSDAAPVRHSAGRQQPFTRSRTGAREQNHATRAERNQLEKKLHEHPVGGGGDTTIKNMKKKKKSPSRFDEHSHALLSLSHNPTIYFFFPSLIPPTPPLSPRLLFLLLQAISQ